MQSQKLQIQHISVIPYDEEEQKHHDFSNLHKDLVTLRQLQKDVSELVGEQGEDLNVAVLNTEKTHEESIKAGYELKKAAKTQAKGWKWMIGGGLMTVGGALGIIGGPVGIGIGSALGGALGAKIGSSLEKKQKKEIENLQFK